MGFKKEENGQLRNWEKYSEEDIRGMWNASCKSMEQYFTWFDRCPLPQYVTSRDVTAKAPVTRRPTIGDEDGLLSANEIQKAKDQFEMDASGFLDEALRAHHGYGSSGVPLYFWCLLLFLGYDDIFRWCQSPVIFWPLMMFGTIAAFLISTLGMTAFKAFLIPVKMAINGLLRKTGLGIQI